MDTFKWHKQSEDDILFAIDDWVYHAFACMMKDGKLVKFSGLNDEAYYGEITTHIDCISDNYDYGIDDIEMWIEIPDIKTKNI